MIPSDGLIPWSRGEVLAWIEVDEPDSREIIYSPDWDEIQDICNRHKLDFDTIAECIRNKESEVYGFLIVAETHRQSLKKD